MAAILQFFNHLIVNYGVVSIIILVVISVTFIVELYYFIGLYGSLPMFKSAPAHKKVDGITVVMVVNQNEFFLNEILPLYLAQDYKNFQIMLVDLVTDDEFSQALQVISENNPKLKITTLSQKDERFKVSNKLALNLGIKAAKYNNIILSTVNAQPRSTKWLATMETGFAKADVVLGYCGIEKGEGFRYKIMCCSKLSRAMKYFSAAIKNNAYRGDINNVGFTKDAYFGASGFNFLNFNMGEDDLFIQKLATTNQVSVVMSPSGVMSQKKWGDLKWWFFEKKFLSSAFKFYITKAKTLIRCELASKFLFILCFLAALIYLPLGCKIFSLVLFILRALVVGFESRRVAKRLGEQAFIGVFVLYDLLSPFTEFGLWLSRTLKPSKGIWR